ncbi:hypothetical protein AA106555_1457 [Neokomagataea thailandica NBRC 106555]|uniref:Transposase n=1 Tax=Neokomagataea thailandica NBRC 106555 TaxID=1223520 RepID=A0ABQ0QR36_9PROT|nr:hypothetical protein AA106555_1457 [Neokomagataea thailandica NBRC 106555]
MQIGFPQRASEMHPPPPQLSDGPGTSGSYGVNHIFITQPGTSAERILSVQLRTVTISQRARYAALRKHGCCARTQPRWGHNNARALKL